MPQTWHIILSQSPKHDSMNWIRLPNKAGIDGSAGFIVKIKLQREIHKENVDLQENVLNIKEAFL